MPVTQIDPQTLAQKLKGPKAERPTLLDVRTHREAQIATLPDALLIPLQELQQRADELEALRGKEVVVYCHHGVRSLHGAAYLESLGIPAASLEGGIDLYAIEADPSLARY